MYSHHHIAVEANYTKLGQNTQIVVVIHDCDSTRLARLIFETACLAGSAPCPVLAAAFSGQAPWSVAVLAGFKPGLKHCSGLVIGQRILLTAAACFRSSGL